jgi:tetratricopeptide (TPR) repeat protein
VEPDQSLPEFGVLTLPEEILEDYPEVRAVIQLRKYLEGLLRLHAGDFKEAVALFKDLRESKKKGESALNHLALGASFLNLGQKSLAEEELKEAQAKILSGEELLYQARGSALLLGLFTFLGNTQEAARWKSFLEGLSCPEGTRNAFLKRAERMSERSKAQGWLLIL